MTKTSNIMSKRNSVIAILILGGAVLIVGLIIWGNRTPTPTVESLEDSLTHVDSIYYQFSNNHLHGIGYDNLNDRLFLATHYGLFVLQNEKLYQLGRNRDDFMGFSLNPLNPSIIYTSGHPRSGGNLGVMKSENSGLTFRRIFGNIGTGNVDFHSMTISAANPKILYGFFQGKLYRSKDEGYSWEFAQAQRLPQQGFCWGAPCLVADTADESVLYAGTAAGLTKSNDFGDTWEIVSEDSGAVVSVGVDPQNNQRIFGFTENQGVAVSEDGGKSWVSRNDGLQFSPQEIVFAFSFDRNNPAKIFLATTANQVFMTQDGGRSWKKIL